MKNKRNVKKGNKPKAKAKPKTRVTPYRAPKSSGPSIAPTIGGIGGSLLGNILAPGIGGTIGGMLGRGAGSLFKSITGLGDYKVQGNTLLSDSVPQFGGSNRSVRIKHREFLTDVSSSTAFTLAAYPINPGVFATFPWLASIAQNWQQYKMHGLIFEFKSTSANALTGTNTALGTVILSTNYDSTKPNFLSKYEMENSEFCSSCKPAESIMHPIECKRKDTVIAELYIRPPVALSKTDLRLTDWGNFQFATAGSQAVAVVGELWVSYDIELLKPVGKQRAQLLDHFKLTSGVSTTNYFGTVLPVSENISNFGVVLGAATITIPSWYYGNVYLNYVVTGASTALTGLTVTPSAGATSLNIYAGDTLSSQGNTTITSTQSILTYAFTCVAGGVVTFAGGTLPTAITSGDLVVQSTQIAT